MSSVPVPDPGISHALAVDRAARVHDLRYSMALDIPADPDAPVPGVAVLSFVLAADDRAPLVVDFAPNVRGRLRACVCNGEPVAPTLVHGHIVLPGEALLPSNIVRLEFDAGDAPLNRREGYLYTIFVPARAHEAIPCFDQPDLKGRFALTLTVPDGWTAVSGRVEARAVPTTSRARAHSAASSSTRAISPG